MKDGIQTKEYVALSKKISDYLEKGLWSDTQDVLQEARLEIRDWIRLHHPATAFGGKNLQTVGGTGGEASQFRLGKFSIYDVRGNNGVFSSMNIYATYFARWYNTGAKQHTKKFTNWKGTMARLKNGNTKKVVYKTTRLTTFYDARGNFFGDEANAIGDQFSKIVEEKLQNKINF